MALQEQLCGCPQLPSELRNDPQADLAEIQSLIQDLDEDLEKLNESIDVSETAIEEQLSAIEQSLLKAEEDIEQTLVEATFSGFTALEATEKTAITTVAGTQASYSRLSSALEIQLARSATDTLASISATAIGVKDSALRNAAILAQIDKTLASSISISRAAIDENNKVLLQQGLAAAKARQEGVEFRDRNFIYIVNAILDQVVQEAKDEYWDSVQTKLLIVGVVANFIPVFGPLISAGIDLLNASISLARGNYQDAAIYALTAVPIIGDAAAVGRLGVAIQKGYQASNAIRKGHRVVGSIGFQLGVPLVTARVPWLQDQQTNSFVAGTGVVVGVDENGKYVTKNIEDIQVGDLVLSGDEFDPNAPVKYSLVSAISNRTVFEQTTVSYIDASGNVETIDSTDNHEYYVVGVGWTTSENLEIGQKLRLPDGSTATVTLVELVDIPEGVVVYNFSVSDGASYFVDDGQGEVSAVWVHNSGVKLRFLTRLFGKRQRLQPNAVGRYRDSVAKGTKRLKDLALEKHEVLQHAFLKAKGLAGTSKKFTNELRQGGNPVIALSKKTHAKVSKLQRAARLHDPNYVKTLTLDQVIQKNIDILRKVNISEAKLIQLEEMSTQFFKTLVKAKEAARKAALAAK